MMIKTEKKHSLSLRNSITIMFAISAVIIEGVFVLFWLSILAPRLEEDMASDVNALAQSNALILAGALSETPMERKKIEQTIDDLMLLKESGTQTPFVHGVELIMDYDVIQADVGSLDIKKWQDARPPLEKSDFISVEVPLFDRSSKELLGIATFYSSRLFFEQMKNDVMNSFFLATMAIMGMLFVCWGLLIILLSPLNRLADSLKDRDVDDISSLSPLKGWISREIFLVKNALDDLFKKIHDYTQGLIELNVTLKTQQEIALDGILVLNPKNDIVSVNKRFSEMWGLPEDFSTTMARENTRQIMLDKLVDPEPTAALLGYLRENPEEKSHGLLRLKDGRTFERYSSPMFGENQTFFGRVWFFHDISEYKRAQEEIQKLNVELEHRVRERTEQLEHTNKELEAFSYSVSHDLRAPLRHIDGFSLALSEDYEDQLDQDGQSYLKRIRKACTLMGSLIDDMLMLSRISRQDLSRTEIDLTSIAREIADNLTENEPDRLAEIIIAPHLSAMADKRLISIVLDNLMRNAWKFSRNRKKARIEINQLNSDSADKLGHQGKAVFYVKDNGAGFDMTYADKLFGAFQRLHGKDEFEGTGIGLATVQRIIHRHGGTIWAESDIGQGATFSFTIEE